MITLDQYFGRHAKHPDAGPGMWANADDLLQKVNSLLEWAEAAGIPPIENDPDTGTQLSGARDGAGDGGFRLGASLTGRTNSAHKEARGVDIYDKDSRLDDYLSEFDADGGRKNAMLEKFGLYREHPDATKGGDPSKDWCHLQTRRPGSGKRTYTP